MRHGTIRSLRSVSIIVADLIGIICIIAMAFYWRIGSWPILTDAELWLIVSTFFAVLFITGTYFRERSSNLPSLPIRTFFICLVGGMLCIMWLYLLGPMSFNQYFGRGVLPISTIAIGVYTTLTRFTINRLYHQQESGHRVLYLGFSESANIFFAELKDHAEVREVAILCKQRPSNLPAAIAYLKASRFSDTLNQEWNSIVIDPNFRPTTSQQAHLVQVKLNGTNVGTLADYYEKNWFQIPVFDIGNDWFLRSAGFTVLSSPASQRIKRMLDVLLSSIVLFFSLPIVSLCALAIRLESRGSVLYSQKRVGLNGQLFTIYKLRTMAISSNSEAKWAAADDPRVTRVGAFLRKSRLDELPQAWNVLKGEMSFIGPRPEQPEFTRWLAEEIPFYELRHQVKPGITGWAQVIFPYGASKEDAIKKLQYELYYIKHQSLLLDLNILVRTFITVIQRSGR